MTHRTRSFSRFGRSARRACAGALAVIFTSGLLAPPNAGAAPLQAAAPSQRAAETSRRPAGPFVSQPQSSTPAFGGQRVDMPSQRPPLAAAQRQRATRMRVWPTVQIGGESASPESAPADTAPATAPGGRTAALRTASVTIGAANATGTNPWWTFEQGNIPGLGQFMVNVGSSKNLIVESEDFTVPHRWVDLAFRRAYNSLSKHDYAGSDGSLSSSFGNGWTNTLDAHVAVNSGQNGWFGISVFDADGARYDYLPADGSGVNFIAPPGQHATLATDTGHCNYYWTKPGGKSYQFKTPVTDRTKPCAVTARFAATAGRLITIYGRNQRSQIGLGYSWDGGVASTSANLNQIAVTIDGVQAASTLTFANTGSSCVPSKTYRLLQSITRPDGTAIYYKYDCSANLVEVDEPTNQAVGAVCTSDGTNCRKERYAYNAAGFMTAAAGPLWSASLTDPNNLATGTNGGYVVFNPVAATNAVASVQFAGVMNYTVNDGWSTSAFNSTGSTGVITYDTRYYDTGASVTNYHDTDGHRTDYHYDAKDRVTSVVLYPDTGSLTRSNGWDDASNNLVWKTDLSGNRTDYAYDQYGNAIAIAAPYVSSYVNGAVVNIRPTQLFAYDAHNNMTASCDPVWSAKHAGNWDGVSTPASCPVTTGSPGSPGPQISAYSDQSGGFEPFGELTDVTTQLGYHRHYAYSGGAEGGTSGNAGVDFGSVTTIAGDSVPQQLNAPTVAQTESYIYDALGNTICRNDGLGWAVSIYDSLGRKFKTSDADDATLTQAACPKTAGLPNSAIYSYVSYLPNGQIASTETPGELQAQTPTTYSYDLDGNQTSVSQHFGCAPLSSCTPGTTQNWYDGGDRLVEVSLPHDANDSVATPWLTRYIYDLSQNNTVTIGTASGYAHGNLVKAQEFVTANGQPSPYWTDTIGHFYEALDRQVYAYHLSASASPVTFSIYDGPGAGGRLASIRNTSTNEVTSYSYDTLGRVSALNFSGPIPTPPQTRTYDPNGRPYQVSQPLYEINANGGNAYIAGAAAQTYLYDDEGRMTSSAEPNYGAPGATLNPTTISYDYYADGRRKDLSVSSNAFTVQNLIQYAYRADGQLSNQAVNYGGQRNYSWTYTAAGRPLTQSDPLVNQIIPTSVMRQTQGTTRGPAATRAPSGAGRSTAVVTREPAAPARATPATLAKRHPFAPTIVKRPFDDPALAALGTAAATKSANAHERVSSGAGSSQGSRAAKPRAPAARAASTFSLSSARNTSSINTSYGPTQWDYDIAGRVQDITYPMGRSYNGLTYDPENELTSYTGYGSMGLTNSYDNRGELTGQHIYDPGSQTFDTNWPHFSKQGFLGYMTPVSETNSSQVNTFYGFDVIDAQANYVQQNSAVNNQLVNKMAWYSDSADRQVQGTYQHLNSNQTYSNGQFNKLYDNMNHMVNFYIPANSFWTDGDYALTCNDTNPPFSKFYGPPNQVAQAPYIWGPNGHPLTMFGDGVHWDGDSVLFTTDENGNLDDIKIGNRADILPDGELVERDRDWSGALVMSHSAGGFSQWQPPNPYHDKCAPVSPPPSQPSNYVEPGTTNPSTALGGYGLVVTQPAGDSVFDGLSYIQGVRDYDAQSGGFSTPDAAQGSTADPLSQKSFSFNSNNPVGNSDPSGFSPDDGNGSGDGGGDYNPCPGYICFTMPPEQTGPADPEMYAQFSAINNFATGLFFVATIFVPGGEFGDVAEGAVVATEAASAAGKSANIVRATGTIGSDSAKLTANMGGKVAGHHAHHIVPGGYKLVQEARDTLATYGIDIDDAVNGVFLPAAEHARLHTGKYLREVNQRIKDLTSKEDIIAELDVLRDKLLNGWRPR